MVAFDGSYAPSEPNDHYAVAERGEPVEAPMVGCPIWPSGCAVHSAGDFIEAVHVAVADCYDIGLSIYGESSAEDLPSNAAIRSEILDLGSYGE